MELSAESHDLNSGGDLTVTTVTGVLDPSPVMYEAPYDNGVKKTEASGMLYASTLMSTSSNNANTPVLLKNRAAPKCFSNLLGCWHALAEHLGLKYGIIDGTLLGQVRGREFVAWDHDVDVALQLDVTASGGFEAARQRYFAMLRPLADNLTLWRETWLAAPGGKEYCDAYGVRPIWYVNGDRFYFRTDNVPGCSLTRHEGNSLHMDVYNSYFIPTNARDRNPELFDTLVRRFRAEAASGAGGPGPADRSDALAVAAMEQWMTRPLAPCAIAGVSTYCPPHVEELLGLSYGPGWKIPLFDYYNETQGSWVRKHAEPPAA